MEEAELVSFARPILGHDDAVTQFCNAFHAGKLPHAWLVTGKSGIGKASLIHHLSACLMAHDHQQDALFGDEAPLRYEIDTTNPIMRQVLQKAHPDFLYIAAEASDKNKSGSIKTDQIREIGAFFSRKSADGGWRIAIIDTLDQVNVNGANAMLKIVEEPPEKSLLFLIASQAGSVLPTIRSRCRHLALHPPSDEIQLQILQNALPDAAPEALSRLAYLAEGGIGFALRISETDIGDLYEVTCRLLADPKANGADFLAVSAKWGATRTAKDYVEVAKRCFGRLLQQAALKSAHHPSEVNLLPFETAVLERLCQHQDAVTLADAYHRFQNALQEAERRYLDLSTVFTMQLLEIHGFAHPK